ncbi:rhamnogalacturonyl hydrolase YesR [Pseudoduganella flava]|uniref:Glycoside hydrolase family 88 protein n=1 Tax=Pseudoduganella flava TaxID=871742 RepID=A0A562PZK5_9BURK|nr:glycoside hydrolase family 88 protein [Pseudoduganella flava]QGZ38597.1 glycoside hydrolase family 88 protein [Pseudoduganella flava]TWI49834.1 rhamnogalacturonyl hydrolase YesR [Pseudoduganella flava]
MRREFMVRGTLLAVALALGGCATQRQADSGESRAGVIAAIDKVNGYWQQHTPAQEWPFWNVATYHTGNLEAWKITRNDAYLRYTLDWAEHNRWMGATSTDKSQWKYTYGETPEHVMFGDWQTCFQVYADLYKLAPDPKKIARAREVMEYQMSTPNNDYWWWSDGLYMGMPVMTRLYSITQDPKYLAKMHDYFAHARKIMYDEDEKLFYRDARYVYPAHQSVNGKKDFWSRGDGWVFAALPRVLEDLPANDPHRAEYEQVFRDMAATLKRVQHADGYWTRSLLDPAHAPGPETSGTAFFTYGYLWGINHGLLDKNEYLPVARKGWHYLTTVAVQPDGRIGYVQPIGDRAIPGQVVDRDSTAHFGVGAFLLAAAEMVRLIDNRDKGN